MSACVHTVVSEGGSTALTESQRGGSHCTSLGVMGVTWAARDLVTCKGTRRVALSCLGLFGLWEGSSVWLLCLLDSSSSPHAAPYTLLQTAVICFSQGLDAGTQVGFSPVKSTFPHLDALVLSHFRVLVLPLKLVLLNVWSLDQSVRQDCLRLYLGSSFCLSNCPFSLCVHLLESCPSFRAQLQCHFLQEVSLGGSCPSDFSYYWLLPLLTVLSRLTVC